MRRRLPAVLAAAVLGVAAEAGEPVYSTAEVAANQPVGQARGIFPGRVIWVHDARAVNQNCVVNAAGHGWFLRENQNQTVIDGMVYVEF